MPLSAPLLSRVALRAASRTATLTALAIVVALAPEAAFSQGTSVITVRGTVLTADAAPVAGALVELEFAAARALSVTTGEDGTFAFAKAPRGRAVLRVRRIGFVPDSAALMLGADATDALTVLLVPVPQQLAPVVVRAPRQVGPLAAFYRRRSTGLGHYIARADIEKRRPAYTSDLLRTTPGLSLTRGAGKSLLRFRGSPCAPEVFLDGALLGPLELDFDTMAPGSIEGIELYSGAASVPAEFSRNFGRTACGTVLVWTREGERREKRPTGTTITPAQLAALVEGAQVFTAQQVDSAVRLTSDLARSIRVPASLTDWSAPATVVAEFIVDERGRVEPLTINVVASSGPGFADAVRSALPSANFTPAVRGGRPVRQFTQLNVILDPSHAAR